MSAFTGTGALTRLALRLDRVRLPVWVLTLSLLPAMTFEVVPRPSTGMTVNYGLNKVRFPAPVPAGSRVRATVTLVAIPKVPSLPTTRPVRS